MTEIVNPTVWNVLAIDFVKGRPRGDGDTCWLWRSRIAMLGDHPFEIRDLSFKSHRLVWVDTPERGDVDYLKADNDLDQWIIRSLQLGDLTAYVYGSAGWDRLLVDLANAEGESASQYLMIEKGWPLYKED